MSRFFAWTVSAVFTFIVLCDITPAHANDAQRLLNQLFGGNDIFRTQPPAGQRPIGRVQTERGNTLHTNDLYAAQVRLQQLGYDVGRPDGQMGARTRNAIRQYQADNGLAITGSLSGADFQYLMQSASRAQPNPQTTDEAPLSRNEMAEMQRGLAALGFDVGTPDGVSGRRTATAISRFLSQRGRDPYVTPLSVARQLVLQEAGMASGTGGEQFPAAPDIAEQSQPARENPARENMETYVDRDGDSVANGPDDAALNEALGRRLLGVFKPNLLDAQRVARWLETMGSGYRGTWSPPEARTIYKRFAQGNEFDKRQAVAEFGSYLADQSTTEPMRLTRIRLMNLGSYDFKTGTFPLKLSERDFGKTFTLYGPGNSLVGVEVDNWNVPAALPVAEDEAQRIADSLAQGGSRVVAVVATFRLGSFMLENDGQNPLRVYTKATVESIALHRRGPANATEQGEFLVSVPVLEPVQAPQEPQISGPAQNNLESWTRWGVPADGERILVSPVNTPEQNRQINKSFDLLTVANLPVKPRSMGTAFKYAKEFGSREEFLSLFPIGRDESAYLRSVAPDPFKQKELLERFNNELLPVFVERAPRLPINMRVVVPVRITNYDIDREILSINSEYKPLTFFTSNLKQRLPYQFKVSRDAARQLLRQGDAANVGKTVYLSFDIGLDRVVVDFREYQSGAFQAATTSTMRHGAVTAVTMYADPALRSQLMSMPLDEFVEKQEELPGDARPEGTYLSRWNIAAMTVGLADDPDLGRRLVTSSEFVRNQNEFGRDKAIQDGLSQLDSSKVDMNTSLYLTGSVRLGKYSNGAFEIDRQDFSVMVEPDIVQLDAGLTSVAAENSDALARFPMETAAAEKLVAEFPDRAFPAIFKIRPVRAELIEQDKVAVRLDVLIDGVFLMDKRHPDRVRFSATTAAREEEAGATSLQSVPERLPLNIETTVLLAAKHGGATLDDATLRQLMILRWEEEKRTVYDVVNADVAPWGRFFPMNYRPLTEADVERLMPRFQAWTQERIRALPDKFVLEMSHDSGAGYGFGAPVRNYNDLLAKVGIGLPQFASYRGWIFDDPQPDGAGGWIRQQSIMGLRASRRQDDRVEIYMPLPAIPSPPREPFARALSMDIDLRAVHATPDAGDGKPAVVFDVVPTEVRWYGDKTAARPRKLMTTFAIAPVETRQELQETALDVLGVTIGMTQAEAEKTLNDALSISRVLELKGDAADRTTIAESARMYVSEDGQDLVGVLYGPLALEPKVVGLTRIHFAALGGVTKGQVLSALEQKYGQLQNPNDWKWGSVVAYPCGNVGFTNLNWTGATLVEGKPLLNFQITHQQLASDPEIAAEFLLIRRLEFVPWGFDIQGDVTHCKPVVAAEFQEGQRVGRAGENIPNADATVLRTYLLDHAARRQTLMQAQNAPRAEPAKVDLKL